MSAVGPAIQRLKTDLQRVASTALTGAEGVEGGIWGSASRSPSSAFPTYEGTGPKTDILPAELPTIRRINSDALRNDYPVTVRQSGQLQVSVIHACPSNGLIPDATTLETRELRTTSF